MSIKEKIGVPQHILASVRGDASSRYKDVILCAMRSTHGGKTGNSGLC